MKVHVTVVYEYDLPDDVDDRFNSYGVEDPVECVRVDISNFEMSGEEFYEYANVIHTEYSIMGLKVEK